MPAPASADWDRVLAVNLEGPFLCAQAAVQHVAAGGAIPETHHGISMQRPCCCGAASAIQHDNFYDA